jgi:hypothetical protein
VERLTRPPARTNGNNDRAAERAMTAVQVAEGSEDDQRPR